MFNLIFNGYFEVKYPQEFLDDLEEVKKKHDAHFMGRVNLRDLGEYVDYQKIEDEPVETSNNNE